jgi:hypothetical protein
LNRPTLRRAPAQSLTELALLMPLLALLLLGLVELGFLLHAHVQVTFAAREAARAASLYSSTRYTAFADNQLNNPPQCSPGIDGWSLQNTIEQAIVRRALSSGCPSPTGAIQYSALGLLDPAQAASGATAPPCPTGSATGWVAGVDPAFAPSTSDAMPTRGSQATLTLCYPYRLIIAAQLFNYYGDPIWISKSVVFQYQQ